MWKKKSFSDIENTISMCQVNGDCELWKNIFFEFRIFSIPDKVCSSIRYKLVLKELVCGFKILFGLLYLSLIFFILLFGNVLTLNCKLAFIKLSMKNSSTRSVVTMWSWYAYEVLMIHDNWSDKFGISTVVKIVWAQI